MKFNCQDIHSYKISYFCFDRRFARKYVTEPWNETLNIIQGAAYKKPSYNEGFESRSYYSMEVDECSLNYECNPSKDGRNL